MKISKRLVILCICASLYLPVSSFSTTPASPEDAYKPLQLYDGAWQVNVTQPKPKTDHLVNHCARTGKFFSCEQQVNGETGALVIFLPTGPAEKGSPSAQSYRTLVALSDASKPGDWGHLTIDGSVWTYTWTSLDGDKVVSWRNVNRFQDNDHIHFELQRQDPDRTWKTQLAGDESRSK